MSHKNSYLGIETGATRTVALFAPGDGETVVREEFGPANLRLMDDTALTAHFAAIKAMGWGSETPLRGIAIGMAGAVTESDRERIRAAAGKVWPKTPCYATNDLETALAAVETKGPPPPVQVLILSGTGSCCFGRAHDNRTARSGGWGHLLGDRGSGYEIGLHGLKAAVNSLDRDGQWPVFGQRILGLLHLNEPEDLIDWVGTAGKPDIAALAEPIFEAAARGEKLAKAILEEAAEALAANGAHCARKLAAQGKWVEFVLSGSVLRKQPGFARAVRARLLRRWPRGKVTLLERESAWGALALARPRFGRGTVPNPVANAAPPDAFALPVSRVLSPTEQRNPRSLKLDRMAISDAVRLMITEESKVGLALLKERRQIERAVKWLITTFRRGGRLFYVGAGTSGRLGILDASECPPTFRIPPEQVQGIIAGGQPAIARSIEGAEDSPRAGAAAIEFRGVTRRDLVIGIAASGRTPFVWGALGAARKRGAKTVLLCFNPHLQIPKTMRPDLVIAPGVGPEVLTGSTRLKAGTATKIVLNMLTTLAMARMGKVMSNLMVDVNASNQKLRERAVRIVQALTGADGTTARAALEKSQWVVKTACRKIKARN